MQSFLRVMTAVLVLGLSSPTAHALGATGERLLIHLKTGLAHDDAQFCVAMDVALAGLQEGHRTELHFDAQAVTDLKLWQGKPTALKEVIPEKLRRLYDSELGIPVKEIPATYRDFLRYLRGKGLTVTFNGLMATLVDLTPAPDQQGVVDPIAEPISLSEFLRRRQEADLYLVY